ncbi:hypothetical protein ACWY4P_30685 [Streptomyces sp. LZ34]
MRALREEEDGRALRRDLAKGLREAVKPYAEGASNAALSIPSHGSSASPALRPAIAKGIKPQADLTARRTGARVRVRRTPNVRGFSNAPKRTQSRKGWRTQSYGNDRWRVQFGKIGWFDDAFNGVESQAREAIFRAMEDMARRIAERAH